MERKLVAQITLAIDPSMGWRPRTVPQSWKGEGHTRGARACRKLEYAANESVTNEYYKPYPDTDSPMSGEEWGYIVGPGPLRREVPRRAATAPSAEAAEEPAERTVRKNGSAAE